MRKIRVFEHMSLDGVIQAPGGPREDGEYAYGGWAAPFSDRAIGEAIVAAHAPGFDLLLGRRTYDIWADYWPKAQSGPFVESFNQATKYVVTRRPESLAWGPSSAIGGDVAAEIRRLREGSGGDLIVWGSSALTPVLLQHGLADEVMLILYPVVLGKGKRFFSESADARELALVSTQATRSGVLVNTYRPVGPVRTGTYGAG